MSGTAMFEFHENIPLYVGKNNILPFVEIMEEASNQLSPTLSLGSVDMLRCTVTFTNLIGEGTTSNGCHFVIHPKEGTRNGWVKNLPRLFTEETRFYFSSTPSGGHPYLTNLPSADALGLELAAELQNAFRKTGPIVAHNFDARSSRTLKGKLDVSRWVLKEPMFPSTFPVHYNEVENDNLFNRAFSSAIRALSPQIVNPATKNALVKASRTIGLPPSSNPVVSQPNALPRLPVQWSEYKKAWWLAEIILASKTGLGEREAGFGSSFLVEPWRLLENALSLLLEGVVRIHSPATPELQSKNQFLDWAESAQGQGRTVIPDGILTDFLGVRMSFECKYTLLKPDELPRREHAFQALATANAVASDVAFLMYPTPMGLREVEIHGRTGRELRFFRFGIGLFDDDLVAQLERLAIRITEICEEVGLRKKQEGEAVASRMLLCP